MKLATDLIGESPFLGPNSQVMDLAGCERHHCLLRRYAKTRPAVNRKFGQKIEIINAAAADF